MEHRAGNETWGISSGLSGLRAEVGAAAFSVGDRLSHHPRYIFSTAPVYPGAKLLLPRDVEFLPAVGCWIPAAAAAASSQRGFDPLAGSCRVQQGDRGLGGPAAAEEGRFTVACD